MQNENGNQPLWLPKGSVRAMIALGIVSTACYMFVTKGEIPERLWEMGLLVIGAYFVQKAVKVVAKS